MPAKKKAKKPTVAEIMREKLAIQLHNAFFEEPEVTAAKTSQSIEKILRGSAVFTQRLARRMELEAKTYSLLAEGLHETYDKVTDARYEMQGDYITNDPSFRSNITFIPKPEDVLLDPTRYEPKDHHILAAIDGQAVYYGPFTYDDACTVINGPRFDGKNVDLVRRTPEGSKIRTGGALLRDANKIDHC